jgi:hypothetical protein
VNSSTATPRQELVFIGVDLDRDEARGRLDPALLTDADLAAGPAVWRLFDDQLPQWDDLEAHGHEHWARLLGSHGALNDRRAWTPPSPRPAA